jgi:Tol biopolymer transport system component
MALAPGSRLGPYEILDALGAGGMGEVYRARDTKLNREVALKLLPEGFAADADRLARFTREAQLLASLNHPNIAAVYGLEDASGATAIVMELVDGEDLSVRLARGPLPADEALTIARQIADALDAAHERGVVHRDLKPANIKVRPDGTVKVLDFGLAKAMDSAGAVPTQSQTLTATVAGMILGTAAYMSPEQARGQTVDARTDLWAFGCVLFEMLTSARAFSGESVTDIIAAVVKEEPRWHDLPAEMPAAVQRLLRRCLTKDRKRRLASAADARLELEEALDPRRSDSPPTARATPTRSPLGLALGIAAAVAAIVGAYLLGSRAAAVPAAPARVTRFVISAPPGTQIVSGHRELAVSPDGRRIAFIARAAADQHIYVRRLDGLESRQIADTEGARDLAFSPDGQWLAFHAGNKILKVSLAGGAPAILADAVHSHGLAWRAADDAIYFAPSAVSEIWKVAASGGSPAVAVTKLDAAGGERSHEWPVFSVDGATLLFTVNSNTALLDQSAVSFLALATNDRHTVRTGGGAFGLTDHGELLFVRRGSAMSAQYVDQRLSPPAFLEVGAAIRSSSGGNGGVVGLSSSGTLAYVPSQDFKRRSLVWISADGTESDAGFGQRGFFSVALSPDGQRAAITIGGDLPDDALYLANAGGGALTPLTKPGAQTVSWSPDGKSIAASIRLPNRGTGTPSRVAPETGRTWETLLVSDTTYRVTQWTPDGRGLLLASQASRTGRRSIDLLALDSTPPKVSQLVDGAQGRSVLLPSLSPDGRWLAYVSNESGSDEVYAQSYPSTTARVRVSQNGGISPMWTKRGDSLYFVAGSAIMSSTVTTQPELRFAVPRVIVNDPLLALGGEANKTFDVAPDGRILAIKEDDSVRSDHIVVVENWLSDVRSRKAEARK